MSGSTPERRALRRAFTRGYVVAMLHWFVFGALVGVLVAQMFYYGPSFRD